MSADLQPGEWVKACGCQLLLNPLHIRYQVFRYHLCSNHERESEALYSQVYELERQIGQLEDLKEAIQVRITQHYHSIEMS